MTNKQLTSLLRDARYQLNARDARQIEKTLSRLPKPKQRSMTEKLAVAMSIAAALILFATLAMPPIVEAVGAWMDRVFGERIDKIESYQALPEEERLQTLIDEYNRYGFGHNLTGASTTFEGVTISLDSIYFSPFDSHDTDRTDGTAQIKLTYSSVPLFGWKKLDFTLTFDGDTYTLNPVYDNWGDDSWTWSGNKLIPTAHLMFAVDPWKLEKPTDMLLTGTVEGKSFEIAFTFDPEKPYAQNAARARETLGGNDLYLASEKEELQRMADAAIPLGIVSPIGDKEFSLIELSLVDARLHLSAGFTGVSEKDPKAAGHDSYIESIVIDGRYTIGNSWYSDEITGDIYTSIHNSILPYHPDELPEESLIVVSAATLGTEEVMGDWGPYIEMEKAEVAFRLSWRTGAVTSPKDEAESAAWIAESNALTDAYERTFPYAQQYDLTGLNLIDTQDGVTMRLIKAQSTGSYVVIDYEIEADVKGRARYNIMMNDCKVNGFPFLLDNDWEERASGQLFVNTPVHFSEMGKNTQFELLIPLTIYDKDDKAIADVLYNFEFALDRDTMNPKILYKEEYENGGFH